MGAIVLPINWRLSTGEIEYIIRDCQPKIFFLGNNYIGEFSEISKQFTFLENIFLIGETQRNGKGFSALSELLEAGESCEEIDVYFDDPYVIIHTAAVKGKPKGATLSHGNILSSNLQLIASLGITEKDSYLNILPMFHIFDIAFAFATMHVGGKNVIMAKFEPEIALDAIEREKISFIGEYPPMLGKLLDKLDGKNHALSSLKYVSGLDHPGNIERLKEKSKAEFLTGFGQCETSGMITLCRYSERPGSAGKESLLAKVKLVDAYDREVEITKEGEICVRRPVVFMGYWNMEAENKLIFRQGWHHTGDIGRIDKDGYLWYVKRKAEKDLIKAGGENVYPAEIEKIILERPEVSEISVIGVPDQEWGEAAKAICVLKQGSYLSQGELIEFVASKIAGFKKPKYVMIVPYLPKTEDGSIDREKVKELYGESYTNLVIN